MVKGYCDNCGKLTPEHSIFSETPIGWIHSVGIHISMRKSEKRKNRITLDGFISSPVWCSKKCSIEWFRKNIEEL